MTMTISPRHDENRDLISQAISITGTLADVNAARLAQHEAALADFQARSEQGDLDEGETAPVFTPTTSAHWDSAVAQKMREISNLMDPYHEIYKLADALNNHSGNKKEVKRFPATIGAVVKEPRTDRALVVLITQDYQTGEAKMETARTGITTTSQISDDFARFLSRNIGVRGSVLIVMEEMKGRNQSARVISSFTPHGPDAKCSDEMIDEAFDLAESTIKR